MTTNCLSFSSHIFLPINIWFTERNEIYGQNLWCVKGYFQDFTERIVHSISKLPSEIKENIQEIRLRTNRPVALTCESVTYYLTDKSFTADLFNNLNYIKVSKIEITETFTKLVHILCITVSKKFQMVSSLLMVVIEWVFPVQVSILKVT